MSTYASDITCSQSRFGVVARSFKVMRLRPVDVTGILENLSIGCISGRGDAESENMCTLVLETSC